MFFEKFIDSLIIIKIEVIYIDIPMLCNLLTMCPINNYCF